MIYGVAKVVLVRQSPEWTVGNHGSLTYTNLKLLSRSAEAAAVLEALREDKWPKLEELKVDVECLPEGFGRNLAEILQGGAGSNLEVIEVSCDSLESLGEVVRVLREGACPKLRWLYVGLKDSDPSSRRRVKGLSSSLKAEPRPNG